MLGLVAKKLGMSQIYVDGKATAVSILEAEPGVITQVKVKEKDGYNAVQVGFIGTKEHRLSKPQLEKLKKVNVAPKRVLKEFRVENADDFNVKDGVNLNIFSVGDIVDISGKTKGHGFAGVMKRHNFSGGPGGHGSMFNRRAGSIGHCEFPGRVVKGQKMPGHYGNIKVTIRNLKVVYLDKEKNLIVVKGAVPGSKGEYVNILKKGN